MKYVFRFLFASALFVATVLCGCSTISTRQTAAYAFPPSTPKIQSPWGRDPLAVDRELESQFIADPREPMRLLVRYRQAKLWSPIDANKACALWLEVLDQPKFPLSHIARIHAMESCPQSRLKITSIGDVVSNTPEPWLKEELTHAALGRAIATGDREWEMKLDFASVDFEKTQTAKVNRLSRAIELADLLKDTNLKAQARQRLVEIAPRFIDQPEAAQFFDVARDFKQAREFENARRWYRKIFDSDEFDAGEKLKALDGIRQTYKLEQTTALFLQATGTYSNFAREQFLKRGQALLRKDSEADVSALFAKYLETQISLARAVWTEDGASEANKLLVQAEKEVGSNTSIAESMFMRARIAEEQGRFKDALKLFQSINAEKVTNADLRAKILWLRAWNLRKAGRLPEAATALEKLANTDVSANATARDKFWLGRTLKTLNQGEKAQAQFDWLIENDTQGWYGLLASRESARPLPPLITAADQRTPASETLGAQAMMPPKENSLLPEEYLTLEWLIAADESDLGRTFLDSTTGERKAGYTDAQLADLFNLYIRTGSYQTVFNLIGILPAASRKHLLETQPEFIFPRPWHDAVDAAAKKFNLAPELIYAVMRQESAFNSFARSPADAFGLMQLIPEAAKAAQKSMTDVKIATTDDLYKPENNIALGAAFIRGLLDRWGNRFVPTVASYNASEKAIGNWLKTRWRGDTLEFVEDVPYEETRNYIKLVMRNYVFYQRLNSAHEPTPFPEWCLADLQDVKP